jgi:DNA-binding Lrp family transcriptional regulator
VLHRIRESLDAENAVASGLLVYVALTEIASDKRSNTFETTHSYIAMRSGLSQRTVQQRIKGLTDIGILKCTVPDRRAPATYTLLAIESKDEQQPLPREPQPLHNVTQSIPNDKQPLHSVTQRSKKEPLPSSKECIQESSNNGLKTCSTKGPRRLSPIQKELADMVEAVLGDEWANDAGKWLNRITGGTGDNGKPTLPDPTKVRRVIAEVELAIRERRIKTTPARYAEEIWKEFA